MEHEVSVYGTKYMSIGMHYISFLPEPMCVN